MGRQQGPIREPVIIACEYGYLLIDFYAHLKTIPRYLGKFWTRVINYKGIREGHVYYQVSYRRKLPEEMKTWAGQAG